jgi:ATP-dependent Clp protease ATP-binding subunit ClpB
VDEVIVFHSLTEDHLKKIEDLQLGRLRQRLEERHIRLELTDEAKTHLVKVGYDPNYGARPLKRAIQKEIETAIGRMLLQGEIRDGQTVLVDYDEDKGRLMFTPQAEAAMVGAG